LHREYQLEKLRPLADTHGRSTEVALFGLGQIGRALGAQLVSQESYFRHDLGLDLKCVAVLDRSGARTEPKGSRPERLKALLERKAGSGRLVARGAAAAERDGKLDRAVLELRKRVWPLPAHRPIFVDVTASESWDVLKEALSHRFHVVLANKRPLAVPQAR